jgi:hypothetical protein
MDDQHETTSCFAAVAYGDPVQWSAIRLSRGYGSDPKLVSVILTVALFSYEMPVVLDDQDQLHEFEPWSVKALVVR